MSSHIQIYADRNRTIPLQQKEVDGREHWFLDFDTLYVGEERTFRFFVENQSRAPIRNLEVSVDGIDEESIIVTIHKNKVAELDSYDIHEFYMTWNIPSDVMMEHCRAWLSLKYNTSTKGRDIEIVETLSHPAFFQATIARRDLPPKPRQSLRAGKSRERKEWNCSFYIDKLGIHPTSVIEFGRVHEGETKLVEVWIQNNDVGPVEKLKYTVLRNDVVILDSPEELERDGLGLLRIAWTPGNDFRLGLKDDLDIDGELVIM